MDKNSKEFLALKRKWYAKLDKEGFKDIENEAGLLKKWSSYWLRSKHTSATFDAKQEYYRLAGQFLHDYQFGSALDRIIWEMHSEGDSVRGIAVALKKRGFKVYKRLVHETLMRLSDIMADRCR